MIINLFASSKLQYHKNNKTLLKKEDIIKKEDCNEEEWIKGGIIKIIKNYKKTDELESVCELLRKKKL